MEKVEGKNINERLKYNTIVTNKLISNLVINQWEKMFITAIYARCDALERLEPWKDIEENSV